MSKKSIFKDLAKYYNLIYSWKEYKNETKIIKSLIKQYQKSNGNDLLEVTCGKGKHIQYLKDSFSILATDFNNDMLAIAQKNIADVTSKQADMMHLDLDKTFDVIICLFSSIGYVKNYKNLNRTTEASYKTGLPTMTTYNGDNIKIARLCVCKKRGILSVMHMHYLIAERDKKITHFIERHELGIFDNDKMLEIMKKNGLKAKFLKNGLMKDR